MPDCLEVELTRPIRPRPQEVDPLERTRCGATMRVVALIDDADAGNMRIGSPTTWPSEIAV